MSKESEKANPVTVAVRVRPLNEKEKRLPDQEFALEYSSSSISLPRHDSTFCFDQVLGPDHTNKMLYDSIASPIVSSSLMGINGTIFAYGQTASGKTFSMQGSDQHPGILRLAAHQIFEEVAKPVNSNWTYSFVASYIEIYNERVKDLLSTAQGKAAFDASADLKIREDRVMGFYADGAKECVVTSAQEVLTVFRDGEKRRHVAGTDMNLKSSRSHTIFMINMIATHGQITTKSRLSLVDLAGSESVRVTNAEGDRLKEGAQINKSLLTLSMVIASLSSGKKDIGHVKYRDSKLTQILRPSLSGNCKTAVLVCISPAMSYVFETLSSLKFASSAKQIQTHYVINQTHAANMRSYQDQIDYLTKALEEEKSPSEELQKANDDLEAQVSNLQMEVEQFLVQTKEFKVVQAQLQDELHQSRMRCQLLENTVSEANLAHQTNSNQFSLEREELLASNTCLSLKLEKLEQDFASHRQMEEHAEKRLSDVECELKQALKRLEDATAREELLQQKLEECIHMHQEAEANWISERNELRSLASKEAEDAHSFFRQEAVDILQKTSEELKEQARLELEEQESQFQKLLQETVSDLNSTWERKLSESLLAETALQRAQFAAEQEKLQTKFQNELNQARRETTESSTNRLRAEFLEEKAKLEQTLESKYLDALQDVERHGMEREESLRKEIENNLISQATDELLRTLDEAKESYDVKIEAMRENFQAEEDNWKMKVETLEMNLEAITKEKLAGEAKVVSLQKEKAFLTKRIEEHENGQEFDMDRQQEMLNFRMEMEQIQQDLHLRLQREKQECKEFKTRLVETESELSRIKLERDRLRSQHELALERLESDLIENENIELIQAHREIARLKCVQQKFDQMFQEQVNQLDALRASEASLKERNILLEKVKMTAAVKQKFQDMEERLHCLEKENALLKTQKRSMDDLGKENPPQFEPKNRRQPQQAERIRKEAYGI